MEMIWIFSKEAQMMKSIIRLTLWPSLKKFPNNRLIKSSYIWLLIVPIFAKALQKVEEFLPINLGGVEIIITTKLPFSWYIFYFSALLFTAANLLYNIRCPRFIKDHDSLGDFLLEKKTALHLDDYATELPHSSALVKGSESAMARAFWSLRGDSVGIRKISRLVCFMLYILGLIGITFIIIQNIKSVIEILLITGT